MIHLQTYHKVGIGCQLQAIIIYAQQLLGLSSWIILSPAPVAVHFSQNVPPILSIVIITQLIKHNRLDNDNELQAKQLKNDAKGVKSDLHIKDYVYQKSEQGGSRIGSRINTITKHISFLGPSKKFS